MLRNTGLLKLDQMCMKMNERPRLITEDMISYDFYDEEIEMFENNERNHDNVEVGQIFVERRKGTECRIERVINDVTVEGGIILPQGYIIWEVIQPSTLLKCDGRWLRKDIWEPEIKINDRWIRASGKHCENWLSIPESDRRVLFCLGVIEE